MARPDLIRRADALDALQIVAAWSNKWQRRALSQAYDKLHRVAAVEAEPVVHGRWEKSDVPHEKYRCSACGGACWYYDYEADVARSRYCPNCGAKMDGRVDNAP